MAGIILWEMLDLEFMIHHKNTSVWAVAEMMLLVLRYVAFSSSYSSSSSRHNLTSLPDSQE